MEHKYDSSIFEVGNTIASNTINTIKELSSKLQESIKLDNMMYVCIYVWNNIFNCVIYDYCFCKGIDYEIKSKL